VLLETVSTNEERGCAPRKLEADAVVTSNRYAKLQNIKEDAKKAEWLEACYEAGACQEFLDWGKVNFHMDATVLEAWNALNNPYWMAMAVGIISAKLSDMIQVFFSLGRTLDSWEDTCDKIRASIPNPFKPSDG
jgi:hypothetical protein